MHITHIFESVWVWQLCLPSYNGSPDAVHFSSGLVATFRLLKICRKCELCGDLIVIFCHYVHFFIFFCQFYPLVISSLHTTKIITMMAQTTTNIVVSYENVFVSREKKRAKSFDTVLCQAGVRRHFETEEEIEFNETFADEHICAWPRKNI